MHYNSAALLIGALQRTHAPMHLHCKFSSRTTAVSNCGNIGQLAHESDFKLFVALLCILVAVLELDTHRRM